MFRCVRSLCARVPYATLFAHNMVLQRVFEAPADKVALRVELPGAPAADFTYGRLQRDVVALADTLAARRGALAAAAGGAPLDWLQAPRAPGVRSVFAQGERTPSCDVLQDTGFYTNAVMCGPGYAYAVALLGSWAVNQLATPMSVAQRYNDELMYVLEHSGARSIIGETKLLQEKFPAEYEPLYVRSAKDVTCVRKDSRSSGAFCAVTQSTFLVDSVYDWDSLMEERALACTRQAEKMELLSVEEIGIDGANDTLHTADDVVRRIEAERAALRQKEKEHLISLLFEGHEAQNAYMDGTTECAADMLSFDSEKLSELNPVFRRWVEDPQTKPTKYDDCLMIYTSGTTARPKGAVHSHASVTNMVRVLQDAWEWRSTDSILHVLPVHHVHGLVNILLCSLASHARCVTTKFDDPARVAHRLEQGDITRLHGRADHLHEDHRRCKGPLLAH
ncbi:long-chain-fatty-acid-coA ligase protein [Strigomonas culicis]|uniref:Long-chain-fatty-acid-coA ligase protein n=1 Tax=Strigomonas culicis TaxID=28005 RepID=S9TVC3_9TRYP|nr:long-chain-fatty-acid-coA ligase protein [Strigomonas culicis]|eukprot:EPY20508.1 long-chain-fatty-acid-coA ligase protein [Strigomonas culicis]